MKTFPTLFGILILCGVAAAANAPNAVPMIYQPLIPTTAKPGSSGFTLTVNGTGFAPGAILTWNGQTRATSVISSSQVQAVIESSDVAQVGTASVAVVNPTPGGGTSNVVFFPVQIPAPTAVFAQAPGLPAGSGINLAGDFNNDGFQDVLVASQNSNGFFINAYYGNGNGTFQPVYPNHAVLPKSAMIAGDFKNQFLDVATLDGVGNLEVFSSHNGSFFLPVQTLRAPGSGIAEGDFNKDGKLDLVALGDRDGRGRIYLGTGSGTFTEINGGVAGLGNVAVGDFNGDGILDLAAGSNYDYGSNYVIIYLGNGDGTFGGGYRYETQYTPTVLSVADVNGDGKLDIVTNGGVLIGNGNGTFTEGATINLYSSYNPLIGDFNGDGNLDIVIGGYLLLGNGGGTFQAPVFLFNDNASAMADFNGDGKLDVVGTYLYLQVPISVSPNALNFGSQNVGTKSNPQNVTLLNDGTSAIPLSGFSFGGADPNDFSQTNNCPASLAVGASCQVGVVFAPKVGGPLQATLNVNYSGLGSPQTVALSGTGAAATVTLTPSDLKYGLQLYETTSSPRTATLTNTGTVPVTISNIATNGPFNQTNNCPASLALNANCQIQVTFKPTGAGYLHGKLSISDSAHGSPQSVTLSGTGTVVVTSPESINFGDQPVGVASSPLPVEVKNIGPTSIEISDIEFGGKDPGDFSQTNNCGDSLNANASCTVQVTFTPQAEGKRSAALEIVDTGGGSPQKVALSGTGTE
jgi:hypothetical protein